MLIHLLKESSFNPYFTGYTTFTGRKWNRFRQNERGFNPYFTGYTTFTTRTFAKILYLSVLQIFFQTLKLQFLN